MKPVVMELIRDLALLFPAFLLVFTVRGFFKALMAKINGDDTAYMTGYLTFNPLAHVDVFGVLVSLFVLFLLGGLLPGGFSRGILYIFLLATGTRWTYPVPVNDANFDHPTRGMVMTSLAGPFGNFLLALLVLYLQKYFPFQLFPQSLAIPFLQIFGTTVDIALWFSILDLIPLPPFDGGYLLIYFLPPSMHHVARFLEEYALFIMLALFFLPGLREIFFGVIGTVAAILTSVLHALVI